MAIKFLCPNGHPLSCGDERAGKPGKCPKCGTRFIVPDAEEIAAAASNGARATQEALAPAGAVAGGMTAGGGAATAGSPSSVGRSTAVTPGSGVGPPGPNPADLIVFLCPNGHRLNGPKNLQGRPGQCPHCGEKFRIPVYEEEPAEEPAPEFIPEEPPQEEDIPVGTAVESDPNAESEAVETFPEEIEIVETIEEVGLATAAGSAIAPLPPGASHHLFDVFSRLWPLKQEGTEVEILLENGKVLSPLMYSPALSRRAFGVFVTEDADGSFRIVAIPWDAVARIDFQGVDQLPPGVFS